MDNDFFLNSGIQPQMYFDLGADCFFNPNLENSLDQFSQFESALSSMVSSPVSASNSVVSNESLQIRELIGKLGNICNSGEVPAPVTYPGSTNTSCYTTPMNSPPKLNNTITDQFVRVNLPKVGNSIPNYPPVEADPGFAERAAKFSRFGSRSFNGRAGPYSSREFACYGSSPLMGESVKLTRVPSSPSLGVGGSPIPDSSSKKRKTVSKGKSKETKVAEENANSKPKRYKDNEGNGKTEVEKQGNDTENEEAKANTKATEPPKDYIHVRARRGQATDSHSLAERVRREKISERMKLLQDLVPGCNKVTGKALMLDEIINYVQSLQRQVEFLSMKLATVNPRLDFNMDTPLHKDPNGSMGHQIDTSGSGFFGHHSQKSTHICNGATMMDPLHTIFRNNIGLSQFQTLCEDELQSMVQMGLVCDTGLNSQVFPGSNEAFSTKIEP